MPAKTEKQERFMQAVAHNPKFAKEAGVPQKVGREFTKKRFADGGEVKKGGRSEFIDAQVELATGERQPRNPPKPPPLKELPPGSLSKGELSDEEKRKRAKGPPAAMLRRHEASFAKGGSIDGCAIRGKTKASHR